MSRQPDNTTVYTLDQLRELILPHVRRYGMRWARVFGSYARGEATGESDIDVLVDVGDGKLTNVCGLDTAILLETGKEADVYDISELLPGRFRDSVLREGILL